MDQVLRSGWKFCLRYNPDGTLKRLTFCLKCYPKFQNLDSSQTRGKSYFFQEMRQLRLETSWKLICEQIMPLPDNKAI